MSLPIERLARRLPRRFPVGATYVIEGYGPRKAICGLLPATSCCPAAAGSMFRLISAGPPPRRALGLSAAMGIPSNLKPKAEPGTAAKKS